MKFLEMDDKMPIKAVAELKPKSKSISLRFQHVYWKFHQLLRDRYFFRKYSNRAPTIYFDKKYNCFISSQNVREYGCCEYVCSELTHSGLHYSYYLDECQSHAHTINEVFLLAYNKAEIFSIHEKDEIEYSRQELEFIKKLIKQGKKDCKGVSK